MELSVNQLHICREQGFKAFLTLQRKYSVYLTSVIANQQISKLIIVGYNSEKRQKFIEKLQTALPVTNILHV